jgi:hypothetical protein
MPDICSICRGVGKLTATALGATGRRGLEMCVASNVSDYWRDTALQKPYYLPVLTGGDVSRAEFDALKKDIEELKKLLLAAKRYDEATGQPDCEADEKVALIKKFADLVGVDLTEIFGKPAS